MSLKKSKKNLGVLLAAMFVMNMILGSTGIAYAAGTTASTTVNGSISASIISVSVPASLAFTIDPNNPSGDQASKAVIQSNTNAPIEISINGGGNSFKQSASSSWKPVDYLPDELNWEKLGRTDTESSLALGLLVCNPAQWRALSLTDVLWVKELANMTGSAVIGQLDPNTSSEITFQTYHGNAFSEAKVCAYNIIWSFSLAE